MKLKPRNRSAWYPIETIEEGVECLVFAKCNKCKNCEWSQGRMFICEVFEKNHPDVINMPITHWMPLPDAPKGGE
jgi:hypothetical protein